MILIDNEHTHIYIYSIMVDPLKLMMFHYIQSPAGKYVKTQYLSWSKHGTWQVCGLWQFMVIHPVLGIHSEYRSLEFLGKHENPFSLET